MEGSAQIRENRNSCLKTSQHALLCKLDVDACREAENLKNP